MPIPSNWLTTCQQSFYYEILSDDDLIYGWFPYINLNPISVSIHKDWPNDPNLDLKQFLDSYGYVFAIGRTLGKSWVTEEIIHKICGNAVKSFIVDELTQVPVNKTKSMRELHAPKSRKRW